MDAFARGQTAENAEYIGMLRNTQSFNEFVFERETKRSDDPSVRLFDEIVAGKRNRGKKGKMFFSKAGELPSICGCRCKRSRADVSRHELLVGYF